MKQFCKILGDWVLPILSIASAIACCFMVCRFCPRIGLRFDYMGVIVGALSILVAFLVGWQIYNAIDIKDRLKEIDELKKDAATVKQQLSESNQLNSSIKFASDAYLYKLDYNIYKEKNYGRALNSRLYSILNYVKATKHETLSQIKEGILDICELLPKINKNTKEIDDIRTVLNLLNDRCKKQTYVTIIQNLDAAINKRFDSIRSTKEEKQNIEVIKKETNNLNN